MDLSYFKVNNLKQSRTLISLFLNLSLLLLILYPLLTPNRANASVTEAFVRFDRISNGAAVTGTACEKTSTSGTETGVVIDFPVGWTISQTAGNWTVTTTNLPTDPSGGGAASAWPGINTATAVNGVSVGFPSTDLSTGTFYCFNFAGASSTMVSGDNQTGTLKTQGGAPLVDSTNWAVSVVAANNEQIVVTASVSATMTFSLSGQAINLGTVSTSSVTSGNVTETVGTNARNGWVSWIKGTNGTTTLGKLHSTVASADIQVPAGSYPNIYDLASTTGYVIDADSGTGTPTIGTGYNGTNSTSGGVSTTLFQQLASNTAPTGGDTVTINARVKITSSQAAATDYTDTLTVTAAGSF